MKKPDRVTMTNEEGWDKLAKTYDRNFAFLRWSQKKLVSRLDLSRAPILLDLACGTGWALRSPIIILM